jgi:Zn-dependent oligopeptidase
LGLGLLRGEVRQATIDVDLASLRPYFELERVLSDGIFFAANRLYGLTFTERSDLRGYHPEVRVWEVFEADGSGLGLFLGDYYTRDTKNGGAWMNSFVEQSALQGTRAVVVNNLNIPQAGPRRADPAHLRRSGDRLPRVRPCASRTPLQRHLPLAVRDERAQGLRRIPLAGQRDVDALA